MLDGDASIMPYMQYPRPSYLANTYAYTQVEVISLKAEALF